jgi:hypothetical protein
MAGDSHSRLIGGSKSASGTDLINGSWNDGAVEALAAEADPGLPQPSWKESGVDVLVAARVKV